MAYYNNEEQELDANGQPVLQSPQSATISGQGGASSNAPGGSSGGSAGSNPSNFVGIQQYLQANKPQTAKLASNVGGYVNQLGDTARQTIGQQGQQYASEVNKNTVNLNEGLVNKAKAAPTQVVSSQPDLSEFYRMRDAEYKGPQSFESSQYYNPASQAVSKAQSAAEKTQSDEGRRALLQEYQPARPNTPISKGVTTLDLALLQSDPNARGILNQAKEKQSGLSNTLSSTGKDASGKDISVAAKNTTQATREAIQRAFSGAESPQAKLERELADRASNQAAIAQSDAYDALQRINSLGDLTPAQMANFGLSPEKYGQLKSTAETLKKYNEPIDLSGYGKKIVDPALIAQNINAQNVASPDDYARYAALNQLMGSNGNLLTDASKAGTANADLYDFDIDKALADLGYKVKGYQDKEAQSAAEKAAQDAALKRPPPAQNSAEKSVGSVAAPTTGTLDLVDKGVKSAVQAPFTLAGGAISGLNNAFKGGGINASQLSTAQKQDFNNAQFQKIAQQVNQLFANKNDPASQAQYKKILQDIQDDATGKKELPRVAGDDPFKTDYFRALGLQAPVYIR